MAESGRSKADEPLDLNQLRLELPCPHCRKLGMYRVVELVGKGQIACAICGEAIDVTNEDWQRGIHQAFQGLSQIIRPNKS